MFADLIFVFFTCLVLLIIDTFSVSVALLVCGLAVHFYSLWRFRISKENISVFLLRKIWNVICILFSIAKKIYLFVIRIFASKKAHKTSLSYSSNFNYCGDRASLENEINTIVFNVSQHYVHIWYDKISENEEFISELNIIMKDTLISLGSSISKVDKKHFSCVVLHIYLHFFIHFVEATQKFKIITYEQFEMKHWAMKDKLTEWCYLESLISTLLDSFGPIEYHNSFHSKSSPLLHSIIVEILTENVMYPLLNILSDPLYLNSWLLKLFMYISKNKEEDVKNISPVNKNPSEDSIPFNDKTTSIMPKILLPNDDLPGQITHTDPEDICQNILNIPEEIPQDISLEITEYSLKDSFEECIKHAESSKDMPSFLTPGRKSSSNINLLDNFLSARVENGESSTILCDVSTIKRSRSADFIQNIPQLKPLNEKDYIMSQSKNNKMLISIKSDSLSSEVEQAEEAVEIEVPTLFSDIKITGTQQQVESGHLPYTLYCIEYIGVFHDTSKCSETPQFVKLLVAIKRRFREFLALQSRLEDNPVLRNCLKGIKGPSRLASPFSNLDKKNIAERKIFLENYLQELCNQNEIVHSAELQEFLAYGGDASIAFVKKATDISVPRIDKMLYRGVKGALDLFRTALPIPPNENGFARETSPRENSKSFEDINLEHRFQEYLVDYSNREPELMDHIRNYFKYFDENSSSESIYDPSKFLEELSSSRRSSLLRHVSDLSDCKYCQCSNTWNIQDESMQKEPFGKLIIDLLVEALQLNILKLEHVVSVSKLLFASSINRSVEHLLDEFSEHFFAISLHMLHNALWPENKVNKDDQKSKTESDIKEKLKLVLEEILASTNVTKNINTSLRKVLLDKLDLLFMSFQYQKLNRCFLFYIFDVIVETLCSKEN